MAVNQAEKSGFQFCLIQPPFTRCRLGYSLQELISAKMGKSRRVGMFVVMWQSLRNWTSLHRFKIKVATWHLAVCPSAMGVFGDRIAEILVLSF